MRIAGDRSPRLKVATRLRNRWQGRPDRGLRPNGACLSWRYGRKFGARAEASQVRRAKTKRLEHSSTKLAVVSARNPPETASWLRMTHLPLSMLIRID